MHLYGHPSSGNVYKAQLMLNLKKIKFEHTPIKWGTPEIASTEFLKLNPAGRVPVLVDGGVVLPESNAQLFYLAQGTQFWPIDKAAQAQVLRWMFWEQYSHEPFIAVARYWRHSMAPGAELDAKLATKNSGCVAALQVMEDHLKNHKFFVGTSATIADFALYAYTHVAGEAGYPLTKYPAISAWCKRIESLPGFIPMQGYDD